MADAVAKKSQDLSCDLPKGLGAMIQSTPSKGEGQPKEEMMATLHAQDEANANVNNHQFRKQHHRACRTS